MTNEQVQHFEHVQADTIEARRILLKDDQGETRITAYCVNSTEEDAGPRLAFHGPDGRALVQVESTPDATRFRVHGPDGKHSAEVLATDRGVTIDSREGRGAYDDSGDLRALLESNGQGARLALAGAGLDGNPRPEAEPAVELYARGERSGLAFAGIDHEADGTPCTVPLLDLGARDAREAFVNLYRRNSSGELEPAAILPPDGGDGDVGALASQIGALALAWCESTGREPGAVLAALRDLGKLTTTVA